MKKLGYVLLMVAAVACKNGKKTGAADDASTEFNFENFSDRFKTATVPYQISDTGLLNNKDTAAVRNKGFIAFIPDSIKKKLVGTTKNVKYIPLAKIQAPKAETYYILKVTGGGRKAALMTVFDKDEAYSTSFPLLIPDANSTTSQVSVIDKAYSVSRNVMQKNSNGVVIEGKDVYAYNAAVKGFTLVLTDALNDNDQELINPIDTFSRKLKFTGDYVKNKKNLVSVRDGRNPNELMVFIHFEKDNGECVGELKGAALMTSTTTAVYRQGGDPCVLELRFTGNSVTLHEVEGCGSHRDVKCSFDATYPKKKEPKAKTTKKSSK